MSTIAAPLSRLRAPAARFQALPVALRVALGVAFITGFSLALRTQAIHARYWIDEGLSVGISSHPFFDVPGILRQDGSPPLYYLLLNLWIDVFGFGEADTHALSVGLAIAARARRLHGRAGAVRPARRVVRRGLCSRWTRSSPTTRRRRGCTRSSRC